MQIVINHLTRMQKGFMCTAGINPVNLLHVRPVLAGLMKIDMLAAHGGPFELRNIVDLGESQFVGRVPEVEDRRFEADGARVVGQIPEDQFRELLVRTAADDLRSIFGRELQPMGLASYGVLENCGLRSLGCYWAREARLLFEERDDRPRIRFLFTEKERQLNVPVTDIRLYGDDHVTPDRHAVERFNSEIAGQDRVLISVGLSRAYKPDDNAPAAHWLQVNNVHAYPQYSA